LQAANMKCVLAYLPSARMTKANVDPEQLKRFARSLNQFDRTLGEMTTQLKGQMRQLEAAWQDQEQAQFAQSFAEAMRYLDRFAESNEEHARLLARKARHIEAYLDA